MNSSDAPQPGEDRNRLFVELLGKHERQLNVYVLSLVPNWSDADDVVQQTRIRLWEQFGEYDATRDFGAWAKAIAHYQVLTYRKRAGRQSKRFTDSVLEKLADTATVAETVNPRHVYLAECLEEVPDDDRKLLARCYSGEETIKQVAAALGRSFTAVRQSLFRLRGKLFECIERKAAKEDR